MDRLDLNILQLVLDKLPDFDQAVTLGRVCKDWCGAARQRREAAQGRSWCAYATWDKIPLLPLWYFQELWSQGHQDEHRLRQLAMAAGRLGQIDALEWVHSRWPMLQHMHAEVVHTIANHGHLAALQWALANGLFGPEDGDWLCAVAARSSHLSILQWLRQKRFHWGAQTCAAAAGSGHLAVLRWARQNGCPWDESTCTSAAAGGHLTVLHWACANGCSWDESSCLVQ